MKRVLFPVVLALLTLGLSACQQSEYEDEDDSGSQSAEPVAQVELTAPTGTEDAAWKEYLGKVVGQNMAGVTDRVFPYYLPINSTTPDAEDREGKSMYDRQLDNVAAAVQRSVLPGNMLAFGSPDSATMANLITTAFTGAKADAMKGSQVLFIGKAEDRERVQLAVEAAGGRFIFVEVK